VDTIPISGATLRVLLRVSALAIEGQVVAPLDRLAFQWDAAAVEARRVASNIETLRSRNDNWGDGLAVGAARRVMQAAPADALPW